MGSESGHLGEERIDLELERWGLREGQGRRVLEEELAWGLFEVAFLFLDSLALFYVDFKGTIEIL